MYKRAPHVISIIILSSIGIVALNERRLQPVYTISVLILVLILIHLTITNSSTHYIIKYTYTL